MNPATGKEIGQVRFLSGKDVQTKIDSVGLWKASAKKRASVLRQVADLYEENADDLFALLTHEAGKNLPDCVGELREAIDFLRFYAAEAELNPAPRLVFLSALVPGIFHSQYLRDRLLRLWLLVMAFWQNLQKVLV